MRRCNRCKVEKNLSEFHRMKGGKYGRCAVCRLCRSNDSKRLWAVRSPERKLLDSVISRAHVHGREVTITLEDIKIPERCPVFGVLFDPVGSKKPYTPSVDRIDSSKDYVKGNVQIISARANILKNNMTLSEAEQLVAFLRGDKCLWEPPK